MNILLPIIELFGLDAEQLFKTLRKEVMTNTSQILWYTNK